MACADDEGAEREFISFILEDPYLPWASLFDRTQLRRAIEGIQTVIEPVKGLAYAPMPANTLRALLSCLADQRPPIMASVTDDGQPELSVVTIAQTLYAGWAYWIGRTKVPNARALTFFQTNRLCDLALLQQRAINDVMKQGIN